jgi:hypothetical protein
MPGETRLETTRTGVDQKSFDNQQRKPMAGAAAHS